MAFFCIGIEVSIKDIGSLGWRPLAVFLGATVFNTLLALGVSWLIFGVLKV
jgi:Kef-type K+ transport system membrane component KefB